MRTQDRIESRLRKELDPVYLEVVNESGQHHVPPGSESHFRIVVTSARFSGKSLIERHREINRLLAPDIRDRVHALALHAFTPEEWEKQSGTDLRSPPCLE